MRYMNWSFDQLMRCPESYVDVIVELAREEQNKRRN